MYGGANNRSTVNARKSVPHEWGDDDTRLPDESGELNGLVPSGKDVRPPPLKTSRGKP